MSEQTLVERLRGYRGTEEWAAAHNASSRTLDIYDRYKSAMLVVKQFLADSELRDEVADEIERLQAEVERLTLAWSDEPPTEPGWYFFRWHGEVSAHFYSHGCRDAWTTVGERAGPIPEPAEPERAGSQ